MDTMNYDQVRHLVAFMRAREQARINKEAGYEKPWTRDPIIQRYRFCNVDREKDKVTKYIRNEWAEQGYDQIWFNLVVARILNEPESLEDLKEELNPACSTYYDWSPSKFVKVLKRRQRESLRVFNPAYIVSTVGATHSKIEYYATQVLDPIWMVGQLFPEKPKTLRGWFDWLTEFRSIGNFIGNQIVTDMRYHNMKEAPDWETFVVPGPGTTRGLNRIFDRPIQKSLHPEKGRQGILKLRAVVENSFPGFKDIFRDPNNLSNCLCEFDKYMRVYNQEGKRPKQKYPGI